MEESMDCRKLSFNKNDEINGEYFGKDSKCIIGNVKNEKR